MRRKIVGMFLTAVFLGSFCSLVSAQDYTHEITVENMVFAWKIEGNDLKVKLSGKTTGWVGVGFNPSDQMKDANIIIGYVKDGKVEIDDEFGNEEMKHSSDDKLGGQSNVTVIGGSEEGGLTTLEFSLPMNSGDKTDVVIVPDGTTTLLLAYGGSRDSLLSKHKFRQTVKVNLTSGKTE